MKNETILVNRTNLLNTREIIKDEVDKKMIEEKQRMVHLEKSLEEAERKIKVRFILIILIIFIIVFRN